MTLNGAFEPWRALVAFTTSNRAAYVRRCLPHLARACISDPRLSLLVALDGDDAETREFCRHWETPLLFSEEREGVGLSKNRVVERFPDYDYYFFVEDDIEVLDGALFARHVELMRASGIHHMSLFGESERGKPIGETAVNGVRILHFNYGSAEFNAFTRDGLKRVGGWHPLFAKYRRWGHTEHSYRFPRDGLAPAPFNVAIDMASGCIRHRPPSVTTWAGQVEMDADGLGAVERELMAEELTFVPVTTIAPYHVDTQPPGDLKRLASVLDGPDRYPLLSGAEHRHAQADFLVWQSEHAAKPLRRLLALGLAGLLYPSGIALRHAVKTRLLAWSSQLRQSTPAQGPR